MERVWERGSTPARAVLDDVNADPSHCPAGVHDDPDRPAPARGQGPPDARRGVRADIYTPCDRPRRLPARARRRRGGRRDRRRRARARPVRLPRRGADRAARGTAEARRGVTGPGGRARREAALGGALVTTAVLVMVVVAIDAVRWHLPALLAGGHPPTDVHALALLVRLAVRSSSSGAPGAAATPVQRPAAAAAAARGALAARDAGRPVAVVGGTEPRAYCAGLVRPRVCVSESALARLSPEELRAVVERRPGTCGATTRSGSRRAGRRDGFGVRRGDGAPRRSRSPRRRAAAVSALDTSARARRRRCALATGRPERVEQAVAARGRRPRRARSAVGRRRSPRSRWLRARCCTYLGSTRGEHPR